MFEEFLSHYTGGQWALVYTHLNMGTFTSLLDRTDEKKTWAKNVRT